MVDWVNKGSYADLSGDLLKPDPVSVLVPTSQHGGDQIFKNNAMTAPGGESGDLGWNVGAPVVSDAPTVESQSKMTPMEPGDDGKPQPTSSWSTPGAPSWKNPVPPKTVGG